MVVEHMVSAAVVVLCPLEIRVLAGVPNVRKPCHCGGLFPVQFPKKIGVDRPAVSCHPITVEGKCVREETFMACHDVGKIAQRFRCVTVCSDMNMYAASFGGIAFGSCLA